MLDQIEWVILERVSSSTGYDVSPDCCPTLATNLVDLHKKPIACPESLVNRIGDRLEQFSAARVLKNKRFSHKIAFSYFSS